MQRAQEHQQNQFTGAELFGILALLTVGFAIILWHIKHDLIAIISLRISFLMLKPVEVLGVDAAAVTRDIIRVMVRSIGRVQAGDLLTIANQAFAYYIPIMIIPPCYGLFRAWNDPMEKLNRVHTAQSLLECQNAVFPGTTPILHLDLNQSDPDEWKSSVPPYEFATKNGLITDGALDRGKAIKVFREQVGPKFTVKALKAHERTMFAIFATRLAKKTEEAQQLLDALARSCAGGKEPDYTLAEPLFAAHFDQCKPFLKVHFHTRTLLCSMFEASKIRGKISPSYFLWLKPVDRTLWYALNRVGAQVPFAEGAGVWNHWKAEQVAFTGGQTIDWWEFLATDELTGKLIWPDLKPAYQLSEIWVENAVDALEEDLLKTGVINKKGESRE